MLPPCRAEKPRWERPFAMHGADPAALRALAGSDSLAPA
jgi:hypothetical protein